MQGKYAAIWVGLLLSVAPQSAHGASVFFGLLGDPDHSYTFTRMDTPSGQIVTEPVGPYPGWLGSNTVGNQYAFFSLDYNGAADFDHKYPGTEYHVQDDIPGRTTAQIVEAAYLSNRLYQLGGVAANTSLYLGPISFAIWQIMDPTPGHVPRDPAAQAYVLEAQQAYQSGQITAAMYPYTLIFVPQSPNIQAFMTVSPDASTAAPEPGTAAMFAAGILLVVVGRVRLRSRRTPRNSPPENKDA